MDGGKNLLFTAVFLLITLMLISSYIGYKNYLALAGIDPIMEDMYKQSSTQVGILEETKKTNELLSECIDLLEFNLKLGE